MLVDRYTKIVLTVIAVALSILAVRGPGNQANALGDSCGGKTDPCYILTWEPLDVNVVNK